MFDISLRSGERSRETEIHSFFPSSALEVIPIDVGKTTASLVAHEIPTRRFPLDDLNVRSRRQAPNDLIRAAQPFPEVYFAGYAAKLGGIGGGAEK